MSDLNFSTPFDPSRPNRFRAPITGKKFHKLTVISIYGRTKAKKILWLCLCDCGGRAIRTESKLLVPGYAASCGCDYRKLGGISGNPYNRPPEYNCYISAKCRCTNPNAQAYANYGGRGIEFRFNSYQEFINELGYRPGPGYELDRIDNNRHYEAGNVRWTTRSVNAINRRKTPVFTLDGKTLAKIEWARLSGTAIENIEYRIRAGWCLRCSIYNRVGILCAHKIR